jgi:hypothetical protein
MRLRGANHGSQIIGLDPLPGRSNYFLGRDAARSPADIPTYARVKYADVYPGIDLLFHSSSQGELEYDFIVKAGANPGAPDLIFEGANNITLKQNGDLVIALPTGELIEHAPDMYQEVAGVRRKVIGGYVLRGEREVGFKVSYYDRGME